MARTLLLQGTKKKSAKRISDICHTCDALAGNMAKFLCQQALTTATAATTTTTDNSLLQQSWPKYPYNIPSPPPPMSFSPSPFSSPFPISHSDCHLGQLEFSWVRHSVQFSSFAWAGTRGERQEGSEGMEEEACGRGGAHCLIDDGTLLNK